MKTQLNSLSNAYFIRVLGSLFLSAFASAPVWAIDAEEIMKKSEEAVRVQTITSRAKIDVGEKGGKIKQKHFDSWRSIKDDKIHYNTLTRFTSPEDILGEAIVMQEFQDNQNNVFIYLPRFKRTRRVDGQDQSKSFMGTVFSYSDIATFHYKNYRYKYLKKEPCKVEPGNCHVIEAKPTSEEVKLRSRYSKSIFWVREDKNLILVTYAYDLDGKLLKRIVASKYQSVGNGKWFPKHIQATSMQSSKFSTLEYLDPKVNTPINADLFNEEGLASIR